MSKNQRTHRQLAPASQSLCPVTRRSYKPTSFWSRDKKCGNEILSCRLEIRTDDNDIYVLLKPLVLFDCALRLTSTHSDQQRLPRVVCGMWYVVPRWR